MNRRAQAKQRVEAKTKTTASTSPEKLPASAGGQEPPPAAEAAQLSSAAPAEDNKPPGDDTTGEGAPTAPAEEVDQHVKIPADGPTTAAASTGDEKVQSAEQGKLHEDSALPGDQPPEENNNAEDDEDQSPVEKLDTRQQFRAKFKTREEFIEARNRQRQEAKLSKITEDGELVPWRTATPERIGRASQAIGLQLYFMFLKGSAKWLAIWVLLVSPILYIAMQDDSPDDETLEVGGLALFSLASFGEQSDKTKSGGTRRVTIFGTQYRMADVTPVLSWLAAAGAFFYFIFCVYFEKRVVASAEEELDKQAVTPGDFTVMVDFIPYELFENGRTADAGFSQVAPEYSLGAGGDEITEGDNVVREDAGGHQGHPAKNLKRRSFTRERWATFQFGAGIGKGINSNAKGADAGPGATKKKYSPTDQDEQQDGQPDKGSPHQAANKDSAPAGSFEFAGTTKQDTKLTTASTNGGKESNVDVASMAANMSGDAEQEVTTPPEDQQTDEKENNKLNSSIRTSISSLDSDIDIVPPPTNPFHRERYALELKAHFENLLVQERRKRQEEGFFTPPLDLGPPTVCDVSLARDWNGSLLQCKLQAELEQQIRDAEQDGILSEKKIEKLRKKLKKMNAKQKESGAHKIHPNTRYVMRAYVTFQLSYDKELCEYLYAKSMNHFWRLVLQANEKRFYTRPLRVLPAPEPTNILWENQDLMLKEYLLKKMAVFLLTIFILGACAVGVLQTKVAADNMAEDSSSDVCADPVMMNTAPTGSTEEPQTIPFSEQVAREFLTNVTTLHASGSGSQYGPGFTACQCDSMGLGTLVQDSELRDACETYFYDTIAVILLGVAMSLVVVVLNIVLKNILLGITSWERPATISLLEKGCVTKVFLAQFVNTALIIILLNAKPFRDVSMNLTKGDYNDYSHRWYATVGAAIALTLAINVFSPHGIDVAKSGLQRLKISCLANCCARSEQDLQGIFKPPAFEYSARCGAVLNTLFTTLLFAPGMPLILLFALGNFLLCYLADKFLVLSFCKRPPSYDEKVIKTMISWLPYAFLLHAVMGVWMLGNQEVFPSDRVSVFESTSGSVFSVFVKDVLGVTLNGGGVATTTSDDGGSATSSGSSSSTSDTTSTAAQEEDVYTASTLFSTFIDRGTRRAGLPFLCLFLLIFYYFVFSFVNLLLRNLLGIFCNAFAEAMFKPSGHGAESKVSRTGFAEDETTFMEQVELWRKAKICPGYQLKDHPEWESLLKGFVEDASLFDKGKGRKVLDEEGLEKDIEVATLETADFFEDDEEIYEDFYSSEDLTSIDDE
ncbi:unnamed protein product [Amoebophrya sp. A120]|nr:unnamed protein product [Amoebophrya sp. A120]|eukprot:GSA120T00024653001.1